MSTRIGHYDLVTELGRGGMGVVYKGHEASLNRYVAIKMLSPQLAHDEAIKERFLREARSMASLNDPHIIQIYYIGEEHGQPYFAMEFVEGESLSSYLKRDGRMTTQQAARVIYQTALGLATAHDRGVVHRDIKPGNLMLDQRGRIKIADFGIALSATDFSKKLTSTGEFVGTPGYLSPEVCTGQKVDLRSDIFSLGIVMFELLTGRMPFTDESPLGLLLEVVRAEIPDIRELNAEVDAGLVEILRRMTAKDPAERYASCHELVADLGRHPLLSGSNTISAKPVLSPAASTSLGMQTPPQLKRPSAAPAAAAAAVAAYATEAQAAPAAAAPRRASVLEAQGQREQRSGSGSALGWAIAAVLLLGVGGASAWVFRDRIPFLAGPTTTVATAPAPSASPAPSPAAAVATPPAATTAPAVGDAPAQPAATSLVAAEPAAADVAVAPPDASDAALAQSDAPVATGIAGASADGVDAGGADSEALGPLRRMAAARKGELAGEDPPREIARVTRDAPRREPPPPRDLGPPKVAVVAIGDPALTGPARQIIEEELMNSGYLVADSDMVPGLERAASNGLPGLFSHLARAANVRAVTVIKVEPIGQTQLNYYGQSDTLFSAYLSVRSYDVHSRSPLNAGSRSKVDFTALNADQKAREAVELELRRVVSSLGPYKPRGSRQ